MTLRLWSETLQGLQGGNTNTIDMMNFELCGTEMTSPQVYRKWRTRWILYNQYFELYGLVCRELILFLEKMVKNETIHLNLYQSITITDPTGNDTFTNVLTWMVQYKFC